MSRVDVLWGVEKQFLWWGCFSWYRKRHLSGGRFYGLLLGRKGEVRELCLHLLFLKGLRRKIINVPKRRVCRWHVLSSFSRVGRQPTPWWGWRAEERDSRDRFMSPASHWGEKSCISPTLRIRNPSENKNNDTGGKDDQCLISSLKTVRGFPTT